MQSDRPPSPSDLPAVGKLLASSELQAAAESLGVSLTTSLVREAVEDLRERVAAGKIGAAELSRASVPAAIALRVVEEGKRLLSPAPRAVVNATGVVAHTNLGRSILSPEAAARVAEAASGYLDLEYDLVTGRRGRRGAPVEDLLLRLFPGRDSLVVNNNAAAILLALRAVARGREVVVSRGELVEIGGAFRVPEILSASGARLREVGTTNRTRLADYREAIGPRTGAVLKVHPSNFAIVGFTESASVGELSSLAREAKVPLLVDWGSGDLVELSPVGVRDERTVAALLDDGADLVTFSGDKLLGGPQSGIAVGAEAIVRKMRRDPFARAVRIDRLVTAALHSTLLAYVRGTAMEDVPTLRMLALPKERVAERARAVAARLGAVEGLAVEDGVSRAGGGASPVGEIPTALLTVTRPGSEVVRLERALRRGEPPIVARIHEGKLILDLRTVLPSQDVAVAERLEAALRR